MKLSAAARKAIPKEKFGLPEKAGSSKGKAESGSYPIPDKKHAAIAKAYAKRFASPSQLKRITAKANRILGKSSASEK